MIPFRFRNQVNWTGHAARSASWRFHTGVRRTRQIAKLCPPTAFTRAAVHTVCRRLLDGNKWQWCWCIHNTLLHPSWYGRMGCIVSGFTFSCLNAWWFWSAAVTSIAFRLDRSPALTSNQAAKKLFYIRIHSVPFFSAIEPLDIATFRKEMNLFFFLFGFAISQAHRKLCAVNVIPHSTIMVVMLVVGRVTSSSCLLLTTGVISMGVCFTMQLNLMIWNDGVKYQ